jgi:triosephosphate isomerase
MIAGNWKMNMTVSEAVDLVEEMVDALDEIAQESEMDIVICPPVISVPTLAEEFTDASFALGAQNMHDQDQGAYTGETSPVMISEYCEYVILGHSERRQHFGETDEFINRKVRSALKNDIVPIVCVGETLAQYEAGQTETVVTTQVRGVLAGLTSEEMRELVVAYEPIWAIGTGRAATTQGANSVIGLVRGTVAALFGPGVAEVVRILYGGSVTPKNIAELMAQSDIDGGLVGGASLKPKDFVTIVQETARVKGCRKPR